MPTLPEAWLEVAGRVPFSPVKRMTLLNVRQRGCVGVAVGVRVLDSVAAGVEMEEGAAELLGAGVTVDVELCAPVREDEGVPVWAGEKAPIWVDVGVPVDAWLAVTVELAAVWLAEAVCATQLGDGVAKKTNEAERQGRAPPDSAMTAGTASWRSTALPQHTTAAGEREQV